MAVLEVVTFPHPVLKQKCAAVTRFDAELHQFLTTWRRRCKGLTESAWRPTKWALRSGFF